jgi:hypothetical protein
VGGVAWGPAIGRAALRGLLLGVVLSLALSALLLVIMILPGFLGGSSARWRDVWQGLAGAWISGMFAGAAVIPLALVEALAATRQRKAVHVGASIATFPLALLVIPLLFLQVVYTVEFLDSGDPGHAANQMLDAAEGMVRDIDFTGFMLLCAMLPAIPLTTYARLRRYAHRKQLATVVPGTAAAACLLTAMGLAAARGPDLFMVLIMFTAVSAILGALLPGAYLRGDQLERWVVGKIWPDDD